jgi:2'-5' RNA ligase
LLTYFFRSLTQSKRRFFIALVPPLEFQDYANEIKEYFAQTYNSRAAQKSPPHITLQPPFEWQLDELPLLEQSLKTFAQPRTAVPITLQGFGAFAPRVIYINVLKTPELLTLQNELMTYFEASLGIIEPVSKTRPFAPHMTVAFRDLTKQNFRAAWSEFQQRPLEFEFTASELTLLIHDGRRWNVSALFPFLVKN